MNRGIRFLAVVLVPGADRGIRLFTVLVLGPDCGIRFLGGFGSGTQFRDPIPFNYGSKTQFRDPVPGPIMGSSSLRFRFWHPKNMGGEAVPVAVFGSGSQP